MKKETQERLEKGRLEALDAVAQRGVMQFRLDAESIKELYALADSKRKPVGTLVREWVLEKLESERKGGRLSPEQIMASLDAVAKDVAVSERMDGIEHRLTVVEELLGERDRR